MLSRTNRQRALVAVVQVLALSAWFSATAVVPTLRSEWGIGATAAVWLTASVQIGFVAGAITSTVFNLADRTTPQHLLAASALGAAACTAALARLRLWSRRGGPAEIPHRDVPRRRLSGGDEVDGVMVGIHRSRPHVRGSAGALTIGSALPHLITGLGPLPWRTVMLAAAALTVAGAVVALALVRPGPLWPSARSPRIRATWSLCSPTADRGWPVSATSGTCGSSTPCGPGCRCSSSPAGAHEATRPWGRPGSSRSALSESQGPSDAYWAVGRQTVSVALRRRWRRW